MKRSINIIGVPLISILIVFALLYWVGMARIVRSQVLTLKESEYVTAARALGAGTGRIIKKHILTNCIGTLIVTTTLQIDPRANGRPKGSDKTSVRKNT